MKLTRFQIQNYRTIIDVCLEFPTFYTALCGKNDAGKTNVLRALRALFQDRQYSFMDRPVEISPKDDWPKWDKTESKNRTISFCLECTVFPDSDGGLHRFLLDYLNLDQTSSSIQLVVTSRYGDTGGNSISVTVGGVQQEALKAQEVVKKLQSSGIVMFHNSTETMPPIFFDKGTNFLIDISEGDRQQLDKAKDKLSNEIQKIAKKQQREFEELLGRLRQRYKVAVSVPKFDPSELPLSITLGDDSATVPLEQWGSGTQNRTKILMALFKARSVSQAETSASKITPVLVIEEPESFLHPSAQAEFSAIIQELAEEFKVQVIVTTHSPHLLSYKSPPSNILLERRLERSKLRETMLTNTADEGWMQPFALALGISAELFQPWKGMLFRAQDTVLLVEGETDKAYFELLQDSRQGQQRMEFSGAILPYNGKDTLKAGSILSFVRTHYKKCIITFDLDADGDLTNCLKQAGFQKGVDAFPIGIDAPGKRDIEGLVPASITAKVFGENPDLVNQALSTSAERKSAKNRLKALMLEELKKQPLPSPEAFKHFHQLAKRLDKAFKGG